ncbi:MAG: hypothetical protein IJK18_08330 [Clostridia bacterium]|nr:hypothetical protein [Clostridia bacterium]
MNDILEEVMEQLHVNNEEDKIKGYIDLFQNKIKSICKRDDFPEKLNYMCIEFAKKCYLYYSNIDEGSNQKVEVTSASDNGQSVGLKSTEIITASDVDVDKYCNRNMNEIANYAYMGW